MTLVILRKFDAFYISVMRMNGPTYISKIPKG